MKAKSANSSLNEKNSIQPAIAELEKLYGTMPAGGMNHPAAFVQLSGACWPGE